MEGIGLVVELSLALGVALVIGAVAHRLHQPAILGYLAAGMLIGPHTPLVGLDPERVEAMAELGILLLMFSLGVQFSLSELGRVRNVAVYGGLLQILATVALGTAIGLLLGYTPVVSLFFGALIALSSTIVVVKVLLERGELDSTHGRIMLGICLVQDLSLVPLIVVLPALAGPLEGLPLQVGFAAARAGLVLAAAYLLGTRRPPRWPASRWRWARSWPDSSFRNRSSATRRWPTCCPFAISLRCSSSSPSACSSIRSSSSPTRSSWDRPSSPSWPASS